jgi:hypothetical protein
VTYGDPGGATRMDRTVQSLRSGMTFGEEALSGAPAPATVRACRACEIAAVAPLDGKLVLAQSPDLRTTLLRPTDFARPSVLDVLQQVRPAAGACFPACWPARPSTALSPPACIPSSTPGSLCCWR